MFGFVSRILTPRRRATHPRRLRARYDAAQTTDDNRRHWAAADGLSAAAANTPAIRRTLRNRARYEVANNSYARGIVLTLANDLIGTGPALQLSTADASLNQRIEAAWRRWATAVHLPEKLRTMRQARAVDGEAFAILVNNPSLPTPVQLDLRLIEADRVTAQDLALARESADGILFDEAGNPTTYHVLAVHPGDATAALAKTTAVPAAQMIHWFRCDRPGQVRGVPDIMPALPLFAQLRRYTLAVIDAAETAADFAVLLYTTSPANEADEVEPFLSIDLERRMMTSIPQGWQASQMKPEQPTTTYKDFKAEIINEIARCLSMPFNVAACNSASYNYSSGRLDHQVYYRQLRVEQQELEGLLLDRIFRAWLDEAALVPGMIPDGVGPFAEWEHEWHWDRGEHIDPQKEASAQETRLRNRTVTYAEIYASRGKDWEAELRQAARELALMRSLGILPDAAGTAAVNPADGEPTDETTEQEEPADAS